MSIVVGLAEAAKTHIEGLTLSVSHSTERVYFFDFERTDFPDTPLVHVLPSPPEITPSTRVDNQWDINIDVAFSQRMIPSLSNVDAAMSDVQLIMDSFKRQAFTVAGDRLTVARITQESLYYPPMLKSSVFQSVFTIGFRTLR